MFNKKEIIFSEKIGVCTVADITKLTANRGVTYEYYVLKSVFDKEKVSYIPVENHLVQLRNLISKEEAERIKNSTYEEEQELIKQEVDYVLNKVQE